MKKFKLILCLCACILGLSACGTSDEKVLDAQKGAQLQELTNQIICGFFASQDEAALEEIASYGDEYVEMSFEYSGIKVNGYGVLNGINSWISASEEIGQFQRVDSMSVDYDDQGKDIIVIANISGTNRTAQVEAIYEDDLYGTLTSITTNVNYTFGEKMGKAGLNTLMGMGTVFAVLILICFIISLFKYISKIQDAFANRGKKEEQPAAADTAIAQIIEKEEQTDDLELIAVITAAIAASGTSGSEDDFVVRSIRRRPNSQWNKA